MEEFIKAATLLSARCIEAGAALVIATASVRALGSFLLAMATDRSLAVPKEEIRLSLGRSLALALELELGADILKTAVAPTWNDIGLLAAIAVLRTALNYFLERELRNAEQRDNAQQQLTSSRLETTNGPQ
ncbi:DUF1622 domain-containing protein [Spirosoma sp.]|uniref:DUF1622 domain-containing protein n=1 Tax=Spirosoma sp. TaxID=1899569 RepID=UPI0026317D6F|nr:DUF1622 domain-containing protein [Spirosoma sp.]MCX6219163.1 DUF1622 domain-containing protein [Spirosoma sp.]